MTTSDLRADDVDRLVRLIEDARDHDPGEALPWALLEGLQRLVPCDLEISYQHHVPQAHHTLLCQGVEPDDVRFGPERPEPAPPDDPFWVYWWELMCSWPQQTGDLRSVVHTGDFYRTDRQWLASPLTEVLPGLSSCMIVSLPAAPGEVRRICCMRSEGQGFSERDRQLASLLRPHVQEIWLDGERRRAQVPQLTAREWEVLSLAATGVPYAVIARQLFISVGTVRKHMEHVRERLGVHSVAAAAAIALLDAPADVRSTAAAPGPAPSGRGGAR